MTTWQPGEADKCLHCGGYLWRTQAPAGWRHMFGEATCATGKTQATPAPEGTRMTITPDIADSKIRDAVRAALIDASWCKDEDNQIDIITTAVKQVFADLLPDIITTAMAAPETNTVILREIVQPLLREIEDTIDEDRANPRTPTGYRPGLQRAADTIRTIRREMKEETS